MRISQGESKEMGEEESFVFLKVKNIITNRRKDRKNDRQAETNNYSKDSRIHIIRFPVLTGY